MKGLFRDASEIHFLLKYINDASAQESGYQFSYS